VFVSNRNGCAFANPIEKRKTNKQKDPEKELTAMVILVDHECANPQKEHERNLNAQDTLEFQVVYLLSQMIRTTIGCEK